jgi:hypothetical protein
MIHHSYRTLGAAVIGAVFSLSAHAVVESGHWTVYSGTDIGYGLGDGIRFTLFQEPTDQDFTSLYVSIDSATAPNGTVTRTLTGSSYTLDSAAALYAVTAGASLSNTLLDAGTSPALVGPAAQPWSTLTVQGSDTFWIGAKIRDGNNGTADWTGLGWAKLRFEADGQLTLLDSAMGYDTANMVVGAVPEPSTWAMLALGLAAIGGVTHRRRIA